MPEVCANPFAQSCMTEEQKYQGALYKEKQNKSQKNNANQKKNQPQKSQHTNGEKAQNGNASHSERIPPPAPSPPLPSSDKPASSSTQEASSEKKKDVNVFDYLVNDESPNPNASQVSLDDKPKEQMKMVPGAPSVFEPSKALARLDTDVEDEEKQYDVAYEENGFSYGADPIKPSLYKNQDSNVSMDFMTPAPKKKKKDKKNKAEEKSAKASDKKRKRGHPDEQDSQEASKSQDPDTPMVDTPWSTANNAGTPVLKHSGLTGGLDRMMRDERVPSPDYEGSSENDTQDGRRRFHDRQSPSKRTRRAENGLGISMKDGANQIMSMFGGSTASENGGSVAESSSQALQKVRRGSSPSDDDGSGKKPKKSSSKHDPETRKSKRKISGHSHTDARPSRRLKATAESRDSDRSDDENRKVVIYRRSELTDEEIQRQKAAYFLSLVNKGPESERGCSINKTLKRYHRDCPYVSEDDERESEGRGRRRSRHSNRDRKYEEEKDLWRALRLKRNDRGEIVVFV